MNENLHDMLDGAGSTGDGLSAADAALLREHLVLQQALRSHADHDRLSADEKGRIAASVAGAIGLSSAAAASTTSWSGFGVAGLVGALLASAFFLLADPRPTAEATPPAPPIVTAHIIDAESTTPSLFPFMTPGPTPAEECAAVISTLRDSIAQMHAASKPAPKPRAKKKRRRTPTEPPTTGD